jgi:hypothetical protein
LVVEALPAQAGFAPHLPSADAFDQHAANLVPLLEISKSPP